MVSVPKKPTNPLDSSGADEFQPTGSERLRGKHLCMTIWRWLKVVYSPKISQQSHFDTTADHQPVDLGLHIFRQSKACIAHYVLLVRFWRICLTSSENDLTNSPATCPVCRVSPICHLLRYIIAGPPLEQISIAEPLAAIGETCLSPQVPEILQ